MRSIGVAGMILVLMAAIVHGACGDGGGNPGSPSQGGGSGQTPQGLAGSWQATRAEFVSRDNATMRVEVVSRGTTLVLALNASGAYTRTITDPGQSPNVETGAWTASQDVLTLRPSGVSFSIEFDYTLSGNSLALAGGHVEFDVNGDGRLEESVLNATLARQ